MSQKRSLGNPQKILITPKFLGSRISSVKSLSLALETPPKELINIAQNTDKYYQIHKRIEKPDGSIRLIYSVKPPLKRIQRNINKAIFKRCLYPKYLTGSVPASSYIKNIELHAGQGTIITIDATNFFPSIPVACVMNLWVNFFHFNKKIAELLTLLCSFQGGLAQGAPTSSYVANMVFWDIEPLIFKKLKENGYIYSRYVDDICISKKEKLNSTEKSWAIKTGQKVFLSKGLSIKSKKTKVMDLGSRQEVNKKTIHNSKIKSSKSDKNRIRAEIHRLNKRIEINALPDIPFEKRLNSIKGKVIHLRNFNKTAAEKFLEDIKALSQKAKKKGIN